MFRDNTELQTDQSDEFPAGEGSNGLRVAILAPLCPDGHINLNPRWAEPFEKAGIAVDYIRVDASNEEVDEILSRVHGVMLPGGNANVHPMFYDPLYMDDPQWEERKHDLRDTQRDIKAMEVIWKAKSLKIPTLGICRGMQEMIAAFEGRLEKLENNGIDHVGGAHQEFNMHSMREPEDIGNIVHTINIVEGTEFANIFKCSSLAVNSVHGEGITLRTWNRPESRALRDNFTIQAYAPDGTVEAIAYENMIGVQFHAEVEGQAPDNHRLLFAHFFGKMGEYKTGLDAAPAAVPVDDLNSQVA